MTEEFKKIDPSAVDFTHAQWAQKTAKVIAYDTQVGEKVDTVMKDGHVETTNTAKAGDKRVVNPSGEQYLIGAEKFNSRYTATDNPNVYQPKAAPIQVIRLTENVEFMAPWGQLMQIKAGGMLATTDTANPSGIGRSDVYGIQKDEFAETYSIVPGPKTSPSVANVAKPSASRGSY